MSNEEYDAQFSSLLVRFEDIFKSFKNSSDLSLELLSVIKSYPTHACSEALAIAVLNHVQASPQHVDGLVVAIKTLIDSDDIQSIAITEDDESDPFKDVLSGSLSEYLGDRLHGTEQSKQTVLSVALLSACATKNRLLDFENDSASYAFARMGLQLPDSDAIRIKSQERKEIVALGACLQLSVAGATMMKGMSDSQEAVVQALKGLKGRGVVTTSRGLHLLDVSASPFSTISQVVHISRRKRLKLLRVNFLRRFLPPKHGAFYIHLNSFTLRTSSQASATDCIRP